MVPATPFGGRRVPPEIIVRPAVAQLRSPLVIQLGIEGDEHFEPTVAPASQPLAARRRRRLAAPRCQPDQPSLQLLCRNCHRFVSTVEDKELEPTLSARSQA